MARCSTPSITEPPRKCKMRTPCSKPSRLTAMNSSNGPCHHVAIIRPSSCQTERNRSQSPESRQRAHASTSSRISARSAGFPSIGTTGSIKRPQYDRGNRRNSPGDPRPPCGSHLLEVLGHRATKPFTETELTLAHLIPRLACPFNSHRPPAAAKPDCAWSELSAAARGERSDSLNEPGEGPGAPF